MDEVEARLILGEAIDNDNSLGSFGYVYADWTTGYDDIILDGHFTLKVLSAIVWWMTNKGKP